MQSMLPIFGLAIGIFAFLALILLAFSGPSVSTAQTRRLGSVRERHGSSNITMEAQMRKIIANRPNSLASGPAKFLPNQVELQKRLSQTGKTWTVSQYMMACAALAIVAGGAAAFKGAPILLSLFVGLGAGAGIPHLAVGTLIGKRLKQFNERFPDAIDLMVRGLRSGLPISETLGIVASELDGPVAIEFKAVGDRIRIGRSMDEALQEASERLGTAEFNFFCVTLAIQRETGGNLAETLSNLSDVLRKRAQMQLKIKALSSEAKASAWIVGALPFVVFGLITWTSPDYTAGFFKEQRLMVAGLGGLTWMSIGVFIMYKMVNFKF